MIRRHLTSNLLDALADTPVVLLNGARQTGKSTLIQQSQQLADRQYLTFDDESFVTAARNDPNGFIAGLSPKVTLDEIQRVPELFPAIKLAVDRRRDPGRFLLTGSANMLLLPKLSESLAGRIEIQSLWPLSQGEIHGVRETFIDTLFSRTPTWSLPKTESIDQRSTFAQWMLTGGYPPVLSRETTARRKEWFRAYVTTILQRDIRDLSNIEDLSAVPRLLSVIAGRAGNLLNYAELSRNLGLPQTTLKRYFALLEMTFLVKLLQPWSRNTERRSVRTPKTYLTDTGLLAHLQGITMDRLNSDPTLAGALLENFVVMELLKQTEWSKTQPKLYFWRSASGREVDIVLEDDAGRIVGIEIKWSATLGKNDTSGLAALAEDVGKSRWVRGVILYTGLNTVPFAKNLHGINLSSVWQGQPN